MNITNFTKRLAEARAKTKGKKKGKKKLPFASRFARAKGDEGDHEYR
jgi:hypothetical protein